MSLANLNQFIKAITTETQSAHSAPSGDGAELARAFSELKDVSGEAKVQGTIKKLSAFAKHKGYDVSEGDVQEYINSLKVQYELNPVVASMMDSYCNSTCHIGSAVGKD